VTSILISIICIIGYGGMIRGILPTSVPISWEGHLAGLLTGIGLAWLNSKLSKEEKIVTAAPVAPSADIWR
jgi:membrane associated rhomboid family serine protease